MSQENLDAVVLAGQRVAYRTLGIEVAVEFAGQPQTIATLEGPVDCQAGDAIVTGVLGERWPVSAAEFERKYEPAEGQQPGAQGKYKKRIRRIHAVQLTAPLCVELSGERGALHGVEGDWCVWYGSDDMAIVGRDIFQKSYELESVPIYVAFAADLLSEQRDSALRALDDLRHLVPHTCIAILDERIQAQSKLPVWLRIIDKPRLQPHCGPEVVELPVQSLIDKIPPDSLQARIAEAKAESARQYTFGRLRSALLGFLTRYEATAEQSELVAIVAEQLAETDRFNSCLANESGLGIKGYFIDKRNPALEPAGLARTHRIGAVADHLASDYQEKWQRLVLATTNDIAAESAKGLPWAVIGFAKFLSRLALVTLGLLAALGLVSFSELSGGCESNDPFAFLGCTSEGWKHWFGPFSFFGVYLLALMVAWFKYALAKAQKWEGRHQDYRLFAESLRVLYVRSLLGRAACVACDLPPAEPTASGWVRLALRSIFHAQPTSGTPENEEARVHGAKACFIEDQLSYHRYKLLKRRGAAIALLSCAGRWGFRLFFAALLVLAINVAAEAYIHVAILSPMGHHFVLIAQVAGLAFWGAMRKVIDTFAWEQEIQRGELVLDSLLRASQASGPEPIYQAANFFLKDQAAWHALHRSRPIEAATGA